MFIQARTKLSLFYVLIIAIGMIIFSAVFYSYSVIDIRHDVGKDPSLSAAARPAVISHTLADLELTIILGNLLVLGVLGFLSYLLAGQTLRPIKSALDAQERFNANASHELRTPLAIMRLENEIFLQEGVFNQEDAKSLAKSNLEEISRMTGMVESLLSLARGRSSQHQRAFEKIDFSALVASAANRIERFNRAKGVELKLFVDSDICVRGDHKLLEQLVSNLVQNAFVYTCQGHVAVTLSKEANLAHLLMSDTGVGISDSDLSRVTEPFFKADQARERTSNGVGLGLAIVKEVSALHGGTFSIASEVGRGTRVSVTLPAVI